ncbi:hypothetical protein RBG61_00475 [Paludicola sp. MB14-C6]|uniref:hypothetical protein n=1 Tax=Paludihabitans sp. MB14-C6 TaxID=3070656 RepID=UPI0027DB3596|nr:hypothetical protein [Paludicola sp. MB14-C6]WMJ23165.1 hypothetical protein RBG61_00475 [Paludicola sp. MB14-C6]
MYNYYSGDSYTSSETSSSNNLSSGIDYGQAKAQRKAEEAQRRQAEIEKQKRYVNFKACTSLINPEKYAQEYKELLQKESKEYNEYINQFPSLNWLTADEQLLFQHSDFLESFTEQEKIKLIVLGRERSITMDDIKKLYIDEDLTNKGVMDFFNTSLRANRFGMTTTDLDTHFQQGKKTERSALLDFAGMYAAAGLIANYNASGSNFSNVPEGQFKGFNLDKPKVNNSGGSIEGGVKTDFYVTPSGTAVPSTGYRYMPREANYIENLKNTMEIPSNAKGTYITFDKFDTPNPGRLQVPHDASIRGSFGTLQIIDDIRIPNGNWGKAKWLEPVTKDIIKYGPGGATQAITNQKIKLDSLTDLLK